MIYYFYSPIPTLGFSFYQVITAAAPNCLQKRRRDDGATNYFM